MYLVVLSDEWQLCLQSLKDFPVPRLALQRMHLLAIA
jgi:hypothetical protein